MNEQEINKRIKIADDGEKSLFGFIRTVQRMFYEALTDFFLEFDTDETGNLKPGAKNINKVGGVFRIFKRLQPEYQNRVLGEIEGWTEKLLLENKNYFKLLGKSGDASDRFARQYALFRWGYDAKKGTMIEGGYLSTLFNNQAIAQRVGQAVSNAVFSKMPLKEFQKQFRAVFVGHPGQGMMERHWRTNSNDLFNRIDRAIQFAYADQFGLNWAIYSGTLEEDSRKFCIDRVNRVFNREQIADWANLEFQGKPKIGYDPFMDCGGFNCRHHLSWVSEGVAKHLLSTK